MVLAAAFAVVGCKSNEQKAEALIKDYMYKHLHDYDSYEVVETKVDSAYNKPFFDQGIMSAALNAVEAKEKMDEHSSKYERAQSSMEIWEDSYSSMGRREYRNARKEYISEFLNFSKCYLQYFESLHEISQISDTLDREFIGWMVDHKYRCNNRGGNKVLGNDIFILDKKFNDILFLFDDDDDEFSDVIATIGLVATMGIDEIEGHIDQAKQTIATVQDILKDLD